MARIEIREDVSLAPLTTFKVGGPARYLIEVATDEQLQLALDFAAKHHQAVLILAGGSNVIASTSGFNGLVIVMKIGGAKLVGRQLIAGAAVMMSELVDRSITAKLAGLEWAGGLPGTFGGAIRGNAGAFGGEIKDTVARVTTINRFSGALKHWAKTDCQFGYRDSYFKQHPEEIIVAATLNLKPGNQAKLRQAADDHIQYRQDKHPMNYPNAGSIFKNTPVENVPKKVLPRFKDFIKTDPFPVVPTAKIIAEAGLQGRKVGGAQVSTKHTNYIVNLGDATGEDIFRLIEKVRTAVQKKFGIALEVEPELVGF